MSEDQRVARADGEPTKHGPAGAERWSADRWGDRWLVSADWFDELYPIASSRLPPERWADFRDRFCEVRARVIAPTFVVARRREGAPHRDSPDPISWPPPLGGVPILRVEREDSEDAILAEVLTACAATRAS